MPTSFCNTDAPDSRYDHNDNRCHSDASLSSRLCLWVPQRVQYAQLPFPFYSAQPWYYHFSSGDTLALGSVAYPRSKPPRASMISSNCATRSRIEVTVHKAFEQHSTGPMNDNSSYKSADAHIDEKPTASDLGVHAV